MNFPDTQKKGVSISEQNVWHVLLVCLTAIMKINLSEYVSYAEMRNTAFNGKFWHWDYYPIASHDYWHGLNLLSNCFYKSQTVPCIQKYDNTI